MLFQVHRKKQLIHATIFCVMLLLPIIWSFQTSTRLETIKEGGTLVFGSINSPTTYYQDKLGSAGFEYELAQHYADFLGLELSIVEYPDQSALLDALDRKEVLVAGANIEVTPEISANYSVSPAYLYTQPYLIYRIKQGLLPPTSFEETYNSRFLLPKDSSANKRLTKLQQTFPELKWFTSPKLDSLGIMELIQQGNLDYSVVGDLEFNLHTSFVPGINKSIILGGKLPLSWVYDTHPDQSFAAEIKDFFQLESTQQLIDELEERYFKRETDLNFFDLVSFKKHLQERLPTLVPYFKDAAAETGIDWRFLAALAYQESHWNPKAVSPTGVRGVMMLTHAAAKEVGVTDRVNAEQSIRGGARYFVKTMSKIPERVNEEDKVWFALAAYNVGYGHLEDARILTQRAGLSPNKWDDVKKHLPLLSKPEYYKTVKRGYARGHEPVTYVHNIRKYIDLMDWDSVIQQTKAEVTSSSGESDQNNPETKAPTETLFPQIPIAL